MATYKERLATLFDANKQFFPLTDAQKEKFVEWALQRHIRLRARDKRWLEKHPGSGELPEAKVYFEAVCKALEKCENKDHYTGHSFESSAWEISLKLEEAEEKESWEEAEMRQNRITFDHVHGRDLRTLEFVLCAGKTNDAKNDLTQEDFINLCQIIADRKNQILSAPSGVSGLSQES